MWLDMASAVVSMKPMYSTRAVKNVTLRSTMRCQRRYTMVSIRAMASMMMDATVQPFVPVMSRSECHSCVRKLSGTATVGYNNQIKSLHPTHRIGQTGRGLLAEMGEI